MRKPQLLSKIIVSGAVIALLAATALKAQDYGKYRFGVGVSVVSPVGSKVGFGPFLTAERNLTDRQALRGTLGYVHFSGGKDGFGTWKTCKLKIASPQKQIGFIALVLMVVDYIFLVALAP